MNKIITLILLVNVVASCSSNSNTREKYITSDISVDENNVPIDAKQSYFPSGIYKDSNMHNGVDTFIINYYSEQLFAMKEPLLFNKKSEKETFRFLWLRSFHNPITVRIEKFNESIMLYWKVSDRSQGHEPAKIIVNKNKRLSMRQWENFIQQLDSIDYWSNPIRENAWVLDGARWIIEGATPTQYHIVDFGGRQKGNSQTIHNACDYLLELTNLEIPSDEYY